MLMMKRVKVPEKMENEIWQNVVNFNGLARWQNTLLVMIFKIDPITVRFEHSFMYRFCTLIEDAFILLLLLLFFFAQSLLFSNPFMREI